jgi:hypothetical protein
VSSALDTALERTIRNPPILCIEILFSDDIVKSIQLRFDD